MSGKLIVSLLTNARDKDSRALKMASSFVRWGYKSIVVEEQKSARDYSHLGIEVISLKKSSQENMTSQNIGSLKKILKALWHFLRKMGLGFMLDFISYLIYRRNYYDKYFYSVRGMIPKADLYYLHSYEYFSSVKTFARDGAKVIYDAHDYYSSIDRPKNSLESKWLKPFQKKIENNLIQNSDAFVSVSPGLQNEYLNFFCKKPELIRNVHDKRLDQERKNLRDCLGIKQSCTVVVSVGNCKDGQRINEIIEALNLLPDHFHLCFLGDGYDSFHNQKDLSKGRLHFYNRVLPENIVSFISGCDVGLLSYYGSTNNYRYALPNGFFQMIAAKIPVIFSNELCEIKALNDVFNFGLPINIGDIREIAETVKTISSNKNTFLEALEKASKVLSWENEEKKLKQIIQQCI